MKPYQESIWPQFFDIFSDNKFEQRVAFFQEELVHFLWNVFRNDNAEEIQHYLDSLASDNNESASDKRQRFIDDMI